MCAAQAANTKGKFFKGNPVFARQHGLARVATNPCSSYVKRRGSLAIHMQSLNACHLCFTSWLSDCRRGGDGALPAQLPGLVLGTGW